MRGARAKTVRTDALLVRAAPYRDADLVVTLVTRAEGKVSAMARSAKRSRRRFGGALEPVHTLEVTYRDGRGELATLEEARVVRVRDALARDLDALDAAGRALRWLRHVCPPRTPEPGALDAALELLDALDAGGPPAPRLARFGLRLLAEVGWAVDLERCVRCGKPCPGGRPAAFDAARGGLVCQACGGAPRIVSAGERAAWVELARGASGSGAGAELLPIVDEVMKAHAGFSDGS